MQRLKRLVTLHAAIVVTLLLGGCGNALMFYETGKLSMTLEARPDSSQPVQGNLGFKQRTAVVAPPKSRNDDPTDSAAMISSFRVKKEDGWLGWGPITIQTALVTGSAASSLAPAQAGEVALAVAGVGVPSSDDVAAAGIAAAAEQGGAERLEELAAKPWSDLSESEKGELGTLTRTYSQYDEGLHNAIRTRLEE